MSALVTRSRRVGAAASVVVAAALLIAGLVAWTAGCSSATATSGSGVPAGSAATSSSAATTGSAAELGQPATSNGSPRLDKLTLVGPPGPMAIPLAYIAVNDKLSEVATETEVVVWENADQLRAMVAGGQGDFVTMPSSNAAIFYNKGLALRLLDISVWNITYLVTADPNVESFTDIKGRSLVVSLKGSVPDVMFQFIATKEGLDPEKDFELRYAADPTQAAQLLLSGEVENAVLSEALATVVLSQSKSSERPLYRALAFDEAWARAAAGSALSPIAGTVATGRVMDRPDVVAAFQREYRAAVEWMLADPDAAGRLVEANLPQLGLKAAPMTASLQNITWKYTTADEARASLEAFFGALFGLAPEVIGGALPADGFYFSP